MDIYENVAQDNSRKETLKNKQKIQFTLYHFH